MRDNEAIVIVYPEHAATAPLTARATDVAKSIQHGGPNRPVVQSRLEGTLRNFEKVQKASAQSNGTRAKR